MSTKSVWNSVKNDPVLLKYFPDFSGERTPCNFHTWFIIYLEKPYLLNVLNTLRPDSVINAVKKLKDKKVEKEINDNPIMVKNEYCKLLESFQTIALNQKIFGLGSLRNYQQCCICLKDMKGRTLDFQCKKHLGCHNCVKAYYRLR